MSEVLTLPLDPTAKAPTNHITSESHSIGSGLVRAFAPVYGGFYESTLKITDSTSNNPVTPSQYFTTGLMDLATTKYGTPNDTNIVSLVVVTDPSVSGNLVIEYQALGAGFATPQTVLATEVGTFEPATRPSTWPSVVDRVSDLPASEAMHDDGQAGLITFEYVVHAIDRIAQLAIMGDPLAQSRVRAYADAMENDELQVVSAQNTALAGHIANHSNPHQVTSAQLGALTEAQQDAAILVETQARQAGDANVAQTLTNHTSNQSNPHGVTLAQVGMYSVSQANGKISAAQTTVNGTISANAAVMTAHLNDTGNPHQVTVTQLGTESVPAIQSAIAAAAATVSSSASGASSALSAHVANTNNPHGVTPAQLGTWTAAALQTLMSTLTNHIANRSNPHGVTIGQLGGMTQAQYADAINNAANWMAGIFNSNSASINNHIGNYNNPHGVSAQALGAVGPWNNLGGDLANAQAQINASGHPVTETGTQYYGTNYSGAMAGNMGRSLELCYSVQGATAYWRQTGGDTTVTGSFPFFTAPGGAQIQGFFRSGNIVTVICANGSLDNMVFHSSLGDNVVLSNDRSYSFIQNGNGLFTAYSGVSGVGQTGSPRSYAVIIQGSPNRGQPQYGYINGAAPPPPSSGGGSTDTCCFTAGSLVLMADQSWQPIETVRAGDWVAGATGPEEVQRLHVSRLGHRHLMGFAGDRLRWSEEHSFWARKDGRQWWWSANPAMWRREVELGVVKGLKDLYSHFIGDVDFAHLDGFVKRKVEVMPSTPDTLVYLPVTLGSPIIVDGYVVGASVNEFMYDYTALDWLEHARSHAKAAVSLEKKARARRWKDGLKRLLRMK
ncbi:hypothetical protein AWB81_01796 [Caballeronia arationis]|uniref:hypothetical protein n=1 Tax=Caballeronia arationis TaxID=1777142 RepID=UPI00074B6E66|nr:hypothetical protein [Caballeronia arationis]SAK59128.1 hypothetical protein AWB81_01796 [Caballeronia arationis]